MAYADVKHSENPPCCLRLTLSRRPAIIRFVILNTKMLFVAYDGEKNFMEKRLHSQKWHPVRRENVDVNQFVRDDQYLYSKFLKIFDKNKMFVLQQNSVKKMWRAALFIAENGLFIIKFENLLIKFNSNFAW